VYIFFASFVVNSFVGCGRRPRWAIRGALWRHGVRPYRHRRQSPAGARRAKRQVRESYRCDLGSDAGPTPISHRGATRHLISLQYRTRSCPAKREGPRFRDVRRFHRQFVNGGESNSILPACRDLQNETRLGRMAWRRAGASMRNGRTISEKAIVNRLADALREVAISVAPACSAIIVRSGYFRAAATSRWAALSYGSPARVPYSRTSAKPARDNSPSSSLPE